MRLASAVLVTLLASYPALAVSPQTGDCTYSITPAQVSFGTLGGSGTVALTTGSGCPWSITNNLSWISFTGAIIGNGSTSLSYQVAPNTGDARSGSVTIAGQSLSVEQTSSSIALFSNVGSMAQLAFGGAWTTTFTLVNISILPAQVRLNFFDDNGNPLLVPLLFPQSSTSGGPLLASGLDRTLSPGAALVIQTAPGGQQTQVGWTKVFTSANVSGFAIFQQAIAPSMQEAVVPLENRNPSAFEVWFDNTGGYATGVALANFSLQPATIPVIIYDDTGTVLQSTTVGVPGQGHTSFNLAATYALTAGKRGRVEFDTPSGFQISALGLRFNPTGAFTTIPSIVK